MAPELERSIRGQALMPGDRAARILESTEPELFPSVKYPLSKTHGETVQPWSWSTAGGHRTAEVFRMPDVIDLGERTSCPHLQGGLTCVTFG